MHLADFEADKTEIEIVSGSATEHAPTIRARSSHRFSFYHIAG